MGVAGRRAEAAAPEPRRDGQAAADRDRRPARCARAGGGADARGQARRQRRRRGTGGRAARTVSSTATRRRRAPRSRTSAATRAGRAQVHQHRARPPGARRRPRRRPSAPRHRRRRRRPRASTTMRASTSPSAVTTVLPHGMWRIRSADRRDDVDRRRPRWSRSALVVDDAVGPRDLVAAVAVHGDAVRARREAVVGQRRHVVAPRPVRGRPGSPGADDDDVETDARGPPRRAPGRPGRHRRRRRRGRSPVVERGHPPELLDDVGAAVRRVERAVHGLDVDGDAPGLAPARRSRDRRR